MPDLVSVSGRRRDKMGQALQVSSSSDPKGIYLLLVMRRNRAFEGAGQRGCVALHARRLLRGGWEQLVLTNVNRWKNVPRIV